MANPNLYEDNKGKVTKESGSSAGVKHFNIEAVGETETTFDYLVHDASLADVKTVFYINGSISGLPNITLPLAYISDPINGEFITSIYNDLPFKFFISGEYLDGVKIYVKKV